MKDYRNILSGGVAVAAIAMAHPSFAQSAGQGDTAIGSAGISDIVVTARKRAESIQSVPIAVTALDSAAIESKLILDVSDLGRTTPNVTFAPISITKTQFAPYIRGIGTRAQEPFQDPAVAISIDGAYLGTLIGSVVDIFDVEQIEVLRGPQGTLQGRNSPAGAINITTRRPGDTLGARFEASYGNFNTWSVKGAIDGPVVEGKLGAKLAAFTSQSDGYVRNTLTGKRQGGQETYGGRIGLMFTPTDTLSAYLTADYLRDTGQGPGLRNVASTIAANPDQPDVLLCSALVSFGQCTTEEKYTSSTNFVKDNLVKVWSVTSNINWEMTDDLTLTSITNYRDAYDRQNVDVDGTSLPLLESFDQTIDSTQFSQELRVASSAERFQWVAGLYYANVKFDLLQPLLALGSIVPAERGQKLNSYAVFGQGTFDITDQWSVSGGFRQSWDKKDIYSVFFNPSPPEVPTAPATYRKSAKFDNLSIELGTEYKFTRDALAYFRFAQGYRSGGINAGQAVASLVLPYQPEKVNTFEAGLKTEWLDRRLRFNLTGFWTDYNDLQRDVVVTLPVAPFIATVVQNQGKARIKGIEVEIVARPIEALTYTASAGYLQAKYRDTGNRLPFAPAWTLQSSLEYKIDLGNAGTLTPSADVSMRSDANINGALQPIGDQDGYVLVNANLTYRDADSHYTVTAYVQNLTDKYYFTAAEAPGGIGSWVVDATPRTYGVRVGFNF